MNDSAESTVTEKKTGFFRRFFLHPNFNATAGILGIIGFFLGIFFYVESITKPDLRFYVSPTRTPIVRKGKLENFSITFQGKPVKSDLSAAEIQIWNAGKQPVRGEDILKPMTVSTGNGGPIYQVTSQPTRDVTGFKVQALTNEPGVLGLSWNILEQNDGVKIQIVYGGNVDLPLKFDGVVVGQKGIIPYDDRKDLRKPGFVFILGIVFNLALLLFNRKERGLKPILWKAADFLDDSPFIPIFLAVCLVIAFLCLALGITALAYYLWNLAVPHPPFPS